MIEFLKEWGHISFIFAAVIAVVVCCVCLITALVQFNLIFACIVLFVASTLVMTILERA